MTSRAISVLRRRAEPEIPTGGRNRALAFAAPIGAVLIGLSAEWLDFRELRVPLLLIAGFGVLATAYAIDGTRRGSGAFARTVLIGFGTWGAAQSLYVLLHVARGESFDASRFGPQWAQAIGLIAAHAFFLGAPTGVVAAVLSRAPAWRRGVARSG